MIHIVGGFCLALAAVVVPLMFLPGMDVPAYPDIRLACQTILEQPEACRLGAQTAGYLTFGGLVLALFLAVSAGRRWASPAGREPASWAELAVPALVIVVVGLHVIAQLRSPFSLGRGTEITREATYVSTENLLWPLLLQMMNSRRRLRGKVLYLASLLSVAALSPFRAILVSVAIFGVVLPAAEPLWEERRAGRFAAARSLRYVAISLLAVTLLGGLLYWQTRDRIGEAGLFTSAGRALVQRLAYPLFQAHFAGVVVSATPVPTLADEILGKMRLRRAENLNQFLYGLVYESETRTVGEMTSLYYGEAVAYAASPPFVWITVAPLLMVAVWLLFRRFGYETGTLIGVQIWRGSLGGLVPLLPALVLQLAAVVALCSRRSPANGTETMRAGPCVH